MLSLSKLKNKDMDKIRIEINGERYKLVKNEDESSVDCDHCELSGFCSRHYGFGMCMDETYFVRDEYQKRIYIAGGIEGLDIKQRKEAFREVEVRLRDEGYVTRNPFDNGLPDDARREDHIRADLKMLLECDEIYMMKGWEWSKGACRERDVALECGLKIRYEDKEQQDGGE